jgi:hypothetical protein
MFPPGCEHRTWEVSIVNSRRAAGQIYCQAKIEGLGCTDEPRTRSKVTENRWRMGVTRKSRSCDWFEVTSDGLRLAQEVVFDSGQGVTA